MRLVKYCGIAFLIVLGAYAYLKYRTDVENQRMWIPDRIPSVRQPAEHRIDRATLMRDVSVLASDEFEGRGTGTPGGVKAREWIASRFRQSGLKPAVRDYLQPFSFTQYSFRRLFVPFRKWKTTHENSANVLGWIDGVKDRSLILVLSAHYDHLGMINGQIFNGADDNASGVAALLATASYFHQHPPEHSILFAAFDAEELGSEGAAAFFRNPPVDTTALAMNINMDMISRNDFNRIFISGTYPFPYLKTYTDTTAAKSPVTVLYGHDRPLWVGGFVESWIDESDHGKFYKAGIPFLYFGVEDYEDYHEPTDDADKIKPVFFSNTTELILDTAILVDHNLALIRAHSH